MEQKKFAVLLVLLIPQVLREITRAYQCSEIEAAKGFYASKVYELLEEEATKLWHLSPLMLFQLYDEERMTGAFTVPEEA